VVIDVEGEIVDGAVSVEAGEPASVILTDVSGDAQRVIVRGSGGYTATLAPPQTTPLQPGGTASGSGTTVFAVEVGEEPVEFTATPDSADDYIALQVLDADLALLDEAYPDDAGEPASVILDKGGLVIVYGYGDYTATVSS
jgi:hypothetical protein